MAALVVVAVLALSGTVAPGALAATGSISGTVTGAPTHVPVAGVEVCAREDSQLGNDGRCVWTRSDGTYEIDSLAEEEYEVIFWPRHGTGLNYLRDGRDHVPVGAGQTTSVDFELAEAGSIEGRVISELDGTPLAGVGVCAYYQWEDHEPSCAITDAAGRYLLVGLGEVGSEESEYGLQFFPEHSRLPYFRSYGGLVGFDEEFDDLVQAEPVPVSWGHVTRVANQTLKPDAEVQGFVTAAFDGHALAGILVCVAPALRFAEEAFWWNTLGHERAKCTRTNSAGAYSVGKLQGGQYKVLFSLEIEEFVHYIPPLGPEEDGYPTQYWREGSSWAQADVLTLTAPTVATAIDALLGPFPPAPVVSPSPPPLPAAPQIVKPRCRPGRHLKNVKGERRCVRSPVRRHRRHSSHLRNAHGSVRAGR
jgi:hypothetical protein